MTTDMSHIPDKTVTNAREGWHQRALKSSLSVCAPTAQRCHHRWGFGLVWAFRYGSRKWAPGSGHLHDQCDGTQFRLCANSAPLMKCPCDPGAAVLCYTSMRYQGRSDSRVLVEKTSAYLVYLSLLCQGKNHYSVVNICLICDSSLEK